MEEKYWELREAKERAFDKWFASRKETDYVAYTIARQEFELFCVDVLEKLMEENSDVLARLKA